MTISISASCLKLQFHDGKGHRNVMLYSYFITEKMAENLQRIMSAHELMEDDYYDGEESVFNTITSQVGADYTRNITLSAGGKSRECAQHHIIADQAAYTTSITLSARGDYYTVIKLLMKYYSYHVDCIG